MANVIFMNIFLSPLPSRKYRLCKRYIDLLETFTTISTMRKQATVERYIQGSFLEFTAIIDPSFKFHENFSYQPPKNASDEVKVFQNDF